MKSPPLLLRLGVSFGMLLGLAWILDVDAIGARMAGLRPGWALLALAISLPQVALSAWRWRFTAARLGIHLPFRHALREYYLAGFLNQVLPGGVAGDVSRAWRHARTRAGEPVGGGVAARAVLFERTSGQLVMCAVALISFLSLPLARDGDVAHASVAGWSAAGVVALSLLIGLRRRRTPRAEGLGREVHRALLGPGALPTQIAGSTLVVASYLAMYLAAARAVGVDTPFPVLLPLVAPVLMSMLIPATIAGWGVREGAAAVLWSAVGLTAVDGVAISTAYGVLVLLSTLPGALILLMTARGRRERPLPAGTADSAGAAPGRGSRPAAA